MYYAIIATLMVVFPILSIAWDGGMGHAGWGWLLVGKWFVFWSVGVRLFLAGVRQIIQPAYTAERILGIRDHSSHVVVRELGFANVAFGTLGSATLLRPGWVTAAALAGGIFYGLAGVNHTLHKDRSRMENVAMISDFYAALVLLAYCLWALA